MVKFLFFPPPPPKIARILLFSPRPDKLYPRSLKTQIYPLKMRYTAFYASRSPYSHTPAQVKPPLKPLKLPCKRVFPFKTAISLPPPLKNKKRRLLFPLLHSGLLSLDICSMRSLNFFCTNNWCQKLVNISVVLILHV